MTQQQVYNPELQQKLRNYCVQIGSQEKAAKKIGHSGALVSQYLRGIYHEKGGDVAKFEERLNEFFSTEEKAASLYIAKGYVKTSISEDVYDSIEICHLKGKMINFLGDSGIGKTMGAEKYVADHPKDAIMITMNPCFSTITSCLRLLCHRLNIDVRRRQDDMWLAIEDRLRGSRKVIIIDEAQHLTVKTLDALRAFCDSNQEVGIALIGNVETVSKRKSSDGMIKETYKQINNRTRLTDIRHTYDLTLDDVRLLFPSLPQKEAELMHSIIQSDQGIRGAINTMEHAVDEDNVTYTGLLVAAESSGAIRSLTSAY